MAVDEDFADREGQALERGGVGVAAVVDGGVEVVDDVGLDCWWGGGELLCDEGVVVGVCGGGLVREESALGDLR